MRDLSTDFVQVFQDSLNQKRQESGHLYLRRPRMMRWEYQSPEEKLFISDGKTVYFYVPGERQVNKDKVSEAIDERMPLMFLVGQSDLRKEFSQISLLNSKPFLAGTKVLRMYPKRKSDVKEIVMEVDPANYHIRRLLLTYSDGSLSEFIFSNVRTNTGVQASLFEFKVPAGVQVLEGIGQ
jgi:outer membrane lipoprotein carrier protein